MSDFDAAMSLMDEAIMDVFADSVVYVPGDGGGERTIDAVIDYDGVQPVPGTPQGKTYSIQVSVRNSATLGISTAEVDTGRDKVKVPPRTGQTAEARRIVDIIEQDSSMVKYGVM